MANLFTKASDNFKEALEAPAMGKSVLIAVIASLFFGVIVNLLTNNLMASVAIFFLFFAQWFVLTVIYWIFEFMFNPKKRNQVSSNFPGVATATGNLWLLVILFEVFLVVGLVGGIFAIIAGILIIITGLAFVVDLFILMKTILDCSNLRAFIAWLLAIILHVLILTITNLILQVLML